LAKPYTEKDEETPMAYKSIVLVASGERDDAHVFDAAAQLAKLNQGHVRVIPVYPDPAADLVYYGVAMRKANEAVSARIREAERETQERLTALAREAAERHELALNSGGQGPSIAVDQREFGPAAALADASVLADVVVIGARCARDFLTFGALFADTLLTARVPVFLVKEGALQFDRAAVAWDGSAQAARAVKAALPILHTAKKILLLQHPSGIESSSAAAKPQTLIHYLDYHGLTNARVQPIGGDDVAMAVLEAARDADCGILIAGGYGRPRLFELVLGGATRTLVDAVGRPHLLLAH
jgi:nucleotide-binding universal stress UspA family protein